MQYISYQVFSTKMKKQEIFAASKRLEDISGGDPTEVDPNVATFARNASQMSDRANVPPTYGTGFALALY